MKEYDYREYYELGERLSLNGETVEVVIDGCACKDCYLFDMIDVACSAYCTSKERPDGESVYFRLVDLAKENTPGYPEHDPNKEYEVYERFQHNGVVAECRKSSSPFSCRDCVLHPCGPSAECKCLAAWRKDGISVYYKRLDDVRPY